MVSGSSTVVTTGQTFFIRNLAKYDGGVIIANSYNVVSRKDIPVSIVETAHKAYLVPN